MTLSSEQNYVFLKNKAGQELTIEFDCTGDVYKEASDHPCYDWTGIIVEDLEITRISLWISEGKKEFKIRFDQLKKIVEPKWIQHLELRADESLQEIVC